MKTEMVRNVTSAVLTAVMALSLCACGGSSTAGSSATGSGQTETAIVPRVAVNISIFKKPSLSKPKAGAKGKVTITWKKFKQTKKTKAIWKKIKKVEVQYSTDPTFRINVTKKQVGKSKTKQSVKGLEKNTTYYVRIRYTDGAGGYSKWSSTKKFKTKKK